MHELRGTVDRPVDVRLRGEVHDAGGPVLLEHVAHRGRVADVGLHEFIVRLVADGRQRFQIAGVRQLVDVDHGIATTANQAANDGGADEPRAAGDDDLW